ncbi:LysR substrate-binding domain-containing protein [Acidovorax sp. CCYZU-2555]|uniref:LysR substrate-binding domain-containing protein n=1 Tax=Acidovorax sp. CCYZU-2555 TaxID=2835042 RepID=UPI001BCED02C|nr:LysR family transcriptional regulator [Acidovorax sp. CCYZU-2555]
MTLEQLRAFVAVVEHGSIRAGARALGMAQSGLTQQVQRLEVAVGATLFTRSSSGISMTPYGTALLARARVVLSECAHAEEDFRHLRGELVGSVRVGMSVEAFARLAPPVIEQLRVEHPKVTVHIVSGPASTLLTNIREGRSDFAITLVSHGTDMSDFTWKVLDHSEPCILCRSGHPATAIKSVKALGAALWVNTRPLGAVGTPSNRLADWFAMHSMPQPQVVATLDSLFETLHLVSQTDYLFLGPRVALGIGGFKDMLAEVPVHEALPGADMCLIQPKHTALSPAAKELAGMLASYANMIRRAAPSVTGRKRP